MDKDTNVCLFVCVGVWVCVDWGYKYIRWLLLWSNRESASEAEQLELFCHLQCHSWQHRWQRTQDVGMFCHSSSSSVHSLKKKWKGWKGLVKQVWLPLLKLVDWAIFVLLASFCRWKLRWVGGIYSRGSKWEHLITHHLGVVVKENMVVSKFGDQEYCYRSSIIEASSK